MGLIECPDCNGKISDQKGSICPSCGFGLGDYAKETMEAVCSKKGNQRLEFTSKSFQWKSGIVLGGWKWTQEEPLHWLNQMGDEGWEIATSVNCNTAQLEGYIIYTLKRVK